MTGIASKKSDDTSQGSSYVKAQSLASALIASWPEDTSFDAISILEEHPELNRFRSVVLDLALEEYCRRHDVGEQVNHTEFVSRYPNHQKSLLRVIQVREFFEANIHLLQCVPDRWPRPGEDFLDYSLLVELGRGAFSRVFLAREQLVGNRIVVVKVCVRGRDESETLGRLQHPHIVPVLSVQHDHECGLSAICMPYLGRATLLDVLDHGFADSQTPIRSKTIWNAVEIANQGDELLDRSQRFDVTPTSLTKGSYVDAVLRIGVQLAEALVYTHRQGLCHCDIKPSNILVTASGKVMLLDFNLAFATQTNVSNVGGTLPYMAPEQLRTLVCSTNVGSPTQIDPRFDIYSFGVTFYELLCGQLPFGNIDTTQSREDLASQLLERQRLGPRPLEVLNPNIDRSVVGLVEHCLAFDPEQRPQSAAEVRDRLRSLLRDRHRLRRWALRNPRVCRGGSLSVGLVLLIPIYLWATTVPEYLHEFREGHAAFETGQFEAAIAHFDRTLKDDPDNLEALFERARSYLNDGQTERAYSDFSAVAARSDDGRAAAYMAYCLCLTKKNYRKAISLCRRAIQQGCSSASVYNNLGYCLFQINELDAAAVSLAEATRRDESLYPAFHNLARVHSRQAMFQILKAEARQQQVAASHLTDALSCIEKTLAKSPRTAGLLIDSAEVYLLAARRCTLISPDESAGYVRRALKAIGEALEIGIKPRRVQQLVRVFPALTDDVRFQSLLQRPTPSVHARPAVYFVDPLTGVGNSI